MISVVIVAKDNPPHIFESIESVRGLAKEIVIGNLGLDQNILDKLKKNTLVKIVDIKKPVPYVELIREEMKSYASCDYVLFLDPDEVLTKSLAFDLIHIYKKYDFISIPRKNIIFGKWIEHSRWWPDYQTRLFKKENVIWKTKIHAQPITKGEGFKLKPKENSAIIHYNYESISQYIEKMNRYAQSQAKEIVSDNKEFSMAEALKTSLSEFISRFYAHEGYKDGIHGLVLSFLQMFYPLLVFMYSWEHKKFVSKEVGITMLPHSFFKRANVESDYWTSEKKIEKNSNSVISKIRQALRKRI